MLDKMRAAINEKDRTIEALVDSGREKDKLFTHLRSRSPDHQETRVTTQLAEMQGLKDSIIKLRNEIQNKDGKSLINVIIFVENRFVVSGT